MLFTVYHVKVHYHKFFFGQVAKQVREDIKIEYIGTPKNKQKSNEVRRQSFSIHLTIGVCSLALHILQNGLFTRAFPYQFCYKYTKISCSLLGKTNRNLFKILSRRWLMALAGRMDRKASEQFFKIIYYHPSKSILHHSRRTAANFFI